MTPGFCSSYTSPHSILNSGDHSLKVCRVLWRVMLQSSELSTRIRQVTLYNCSLDRYSASPLARHMIIASKEKRVLLLV
jgi:hypothetical protein